MLFTIVVCLNTRNGQTCCRGEGLAMSGSIMESEGNKCLSLLSYFNQGGLDHARPTSFHHVWIIRKDELKLMTISTHEASCRDWNSMVCGLRAAQSNLLDCCISRLDSPPLPHYQTLYLRLIYKTRKVFTAHQGGSPLVAPHQQLPTSSQPSHQTEIPSY